MLVPWTVKGVGKDETSSLPWSTYSRWPKKVAFLHPPATPKFPWLPFVNPINPPPVTKSLTLQSSAFAAPLASARARVAMPGARRVQIARIIIPPLLNGRGGGPEDHVCDTVDDKMQGVHDDAARGGRLL